MLAQLARPPRLVCTRCHIFAFALGGLLPGDGRSGAKPVMKILAHLAAPPWELTISLTKYVHTYYSPRLTHT